MRHLGKVRLRYGADEGFMAVKSVAAKKRLMYAKSLLVLRYFK